MPKPRTWLYIALGSLGVVVLVTVAVLGAGAWFLSTHIQVESSESGNGDSFEQVKQRFAGQAPLIDQHASGVEATREFERRRAAYNGPLPESLHLLVWDKREQRLVRLSFPFWLLRFQSRSELRVDVDGFRMEDLGVTTEDLRLAGPALVLDHEDAKNRVLMWTE